MAGMGKTKVLLVLAVAGCIKTRYSDTRYRDVSSETTSVELGKLVDPRAKLDGKDVVVDPVVGQGCRTILTTKQAADEIHDRSWELEQILVPPLLFFWFLVPLPDKVETSYSTRREWQGRAHLCQGHEVATGAQMRVELRYPKAEYTVYRDLAVPAEGGLRFEGWWERGETIAGYCGRGELLVAAKLPETPPKSADTEDESFEEPYRGLRSVRYAFPIEAKLARSYDIKNGNLHDLNVIASCLDQRCVETTGSKARARCQARCSESLAPATCDAERTKCTSIAEDDAQRATCGKFFDECLANHRVDNSKVAGCAELCVVRESVGGCQ